MCTNTKLLDSVSQSHIYNNNYLKEEFSSVTKAVNVLSCTRRLSLCDCHGNESVDMHTENYVMHLKVYKTNTAVAVQLGLLPH